MLLTALVTVQLFNAGSLLTKGSLEARSICQCLPQGYAGYLKGDA